MKPDAWVRPSPTTACALYGGADRRLPHPLLAITLSFHRRHTLPPDHAPYPPPRLSLPVALPLSPLLLVTMGHAAVWNSHPKGYGKGSRACRVCGSKIGLIRKYSLDICRRCFRENANAIGFHKVCWLLAWGHECAVPVVMGDVGGVWWMMSGDGGGWVVGMEVRRVGRMSGWQWGRQGWKRTGGDEWVLMCWCE